jgi:hypothetical protein
VNRLSLLVIVLVLLGCKDPYSFEPHDPDLPDPPGAPTLSYPENGRNTKDYGYPQDVALGWNPVSRAEFYQIEVFTDSVLVEANLYTTVDRANGTEHVLSCRSYGFYYWRVRADSPHRWNRASDWSAVRFFVCPNPAD